MTADLEVGRGFPHALYMWLDFSHSMVALESHMQGYVCKHECSTKQDKDMSSFSEPASENIVISITFYRSMQS